MEEAAILKIPAVQLRNSSERPEGYDKGVLILSGMDEDNVISVVDAVVDQSARGEKIATPDAYCDENFSLKIVRHILGLTRILKEKKKIGFMP